MNHNIPKKWKDNLRKYTKKHFGEARDYLTSMDFKCNESVCLEFPDGSKMLFKFAFYIHDKNNKEIAIFTEHCGYYFFKTWDLKWNLLKNGKAEEKCRD
ncbi:hypothetical protein A2526_01250 [candidate division WOR-1 bacterium RIFOXYD2_FULL_36_8]|nr:MAG: hypothetical protein A2282_02380 [candidate division WOR-1 bacterium RIFOXYA12_FULL_36_13]OGC38914.1 MAG: hypothetical protein A2526_01250 [candidate division WOR-1 bacterium RIFOXYD2_FULL_36_8]